MKLGKSLIITGLLFSSVLGSVNVGSITALAAEKTQQGQSEAGSGIKDPNKDKATINVKYVDNIDKKQIVNSKLNSSIEVTLNADKTINQTSIDTTNLKDNGYKLIKIEAKDKDDKYTLVVEKIADSKPSNMEVGINYIYNPGELTVADASKLKSTMTVSVKDGVVDKSSINLDNDKYKITGEPKLDGKTLTLTIKKIVRIDIEINYVDENSEDIKGLNNGSIKGKDIEEEVKNSELPIPEGYIIDERDNHSFNQKDLLKGEKGYSLKVGVKKLINTVIEYKAPNGKTVGSQRAATLPDSEITLNIPKGFIMTDNTNGTIKAGSKDSTKVILVIPANPAKPVKPAPKPVKIATSVNFIDLATKKPVYSYILQGLPGQKFDIVAPDGYNLDKKAITKYALDKSKTSINIYVVEKKSAGEVKSYESVVNTKKSMTNLFDNMGKTVANRALGSNSSWKVDQKMVIDGETYYRVATNEWVKASDIAEYTGINRTITTQSGNYKALFDVNGKQSSVRALAANTSWFTDRIATINGQKMYRVATNEWIKASDIK